MPVENVGYSYVIKLKRESVSYWRCSVRNMTSICPATITQRERKFTRGAHAHNHAANSEVSIRQS